MPNRNVLRFCLSTLSFVVWVACTGPASAAGEGYLFGVEIPWNVTFSGKQLPSGRYVVVVEDPDEICHAAFHSLEEFSKDTESQPVASVTGACLLDDGLIPGENVDSNYTSVDVLNSSSKKLSIVVFETTDLEIAKTRVIMIPLRRGSQQN